VSNHPALAANRVAVVTGAASGIGLAASAKFAALGMKVCMADANRAALEAAATKLRATAARPEDVRSFTVDVSNFDDVERLKTSVYEAFGDVALLMNNAGVGGGGGLFGDRAKWRRVIDVNLWGVINGVQIFAPTMIRQGAASAIVNTGVEARHYLSARRYGLQCLESGRKGRDRGAGPRIAQHRRLSGERPSAHSRLHLHRHNRRVEC